MDMDFSKFYNYLTEAEAKTPSGQAGKTFKDIAVGWFYIPHPTNGKDFGPKGKGTGISKILVRESGNTWDAFLLEKTTTATMQATNPKDVTATRDAIAKRASQTKTAKETLGQDMNMDKLLALSESYFAGKLNEGKVLNEAGGAEDGGDVSMLDDSTYTVVAAETGMPFDKVLKLCVGVVTGEPVEGGNSALIKNLKA